MGIETVPGVLILSNGRRFPGQLLAPGGKPMDGGGEVVFQTGMTGYQEVITDPSYRGQIVTFTSSHIGNTGIVPDDDEAAAPALAGIVTRALTERPSNWRSQETLPHYLARHGIPCLTGVDTRALTKTLRDAGALLGVLAPAAASSKQTEARLKGLSGVVGRDLVREVLPPDPAQRPPSSWEGESLAQVFPPVSGTGQGLRVTVVHAGLKAGIDALVRDQGAEVTVVGADRPAAEWLANKPHALVLSNGPGDPAAIPYLVESVREVVGRVPILGICLGFQVLAQVLGATTRKMAHGHHGINHPVQEKRTGRVLVTSQNHEFEVVGDTLPPDAEITHVSLNDGTCEGFFHPGLKVTAVQFHPEARGGPHDAVRVMHGFLQEVGAGAS